MWSVEEWAWINGTVLYHETGARSRSDFHEDLFTIWFCSIFNSSPPSAAYIRQWTGLVLVQIMACRLDGAKPLSEPLLTYCQLDPKEHISITFYSKLKYLHSRKMRWNMSCAFFPRGDELNLAMLNLFQLLNIFYLLCKIYFCSGLWKIMCIFYGLYFMLGMCPPLCSLLAC